MSILENIFGKVNGIIEEKVFGKGESIYSDLKRLEILTSILFKNKKLIKISETKCGLDDQFIFLPPLCNDFDEPKKNKLFFEFRILLFYGLSKYYPEKKSGIDFETPAKYLPKSWKFLTNEFPGIQEKFGQIFPDSSKKLINGINSSFKETIFFSGAFYDPEKMESPNPLNFGNRQNGKDYSLKKSGHAEITEVEKNENGENPLVHNFEKLKTAEEYFGGNKSFDGSDEINDQINALKDLKWNKVIRTTDKSESNLKIDVSRNSEGLEIIENNEVLSDEKLYKYPEYHFRKKQNVMDWCHVYESIMPSFSGRSLNFKYKKTIDRLRSELICRIFSRRIRNRQLSGEQVDLDALVDFYADMKHQAIVSDRLYLKKKNTFQEISIFFLLDLSQSMDSWRNNNRVLDMATEALMILGEVFSELVPTMGIGGFFSLTRKNCQFKIIKSFEDSWELSRSKLTGLKTEGHTRIGAALRHGQYLLNKTKNKRRLLVLLTDGKPIDYDRYEGQYGEKDIQMAIHQGKKEGISTFAFAFEKESHQSFTNMFGKNSYEIVKNPAQIGERFLDFITYKY